MNTAPTNTLADRVFRSSTPETRHVWASAGGRWRVRDQDALRELATALMGDGVYVEGESRTRSGYLQLFVGVRDNRNAVEHSQRCEELVRALKGAGLKVRRQRLDGRTNGAIVTDRLTKGEA